MTAALWSGLGARPGSTPTPKLAEHEPDDFARPSVKRIVPAAGTPSVLPASPFSHPFPASAGSADEPGDEGAAATHHEEKGMPKEQAAPAQAGPRNLQQRICALILAAESISREGLAERLPDIDSKQLSNTLFNIHTAKRAKKVQTLDGPVWQLTPFGRKWIESGKGRASTHKPKAAAPKPARRAKKAAKAAKAEPVQRTRARPGSKVRKPSAASTATFAEPAGGTLALRAFEPVVERSFRCAVFSDGAFHLAKNGQAIDLTAAEFAETVRYLDRMAEPQPAA